MGKHILTSRARLRRIVLCVVAFAAVGFGEQGRRTLLQGAGLEAQTAWPDKHFTVDAAGNISPSAGLRPQRSKGRLDVCNRQARPMRSCGRPGFTPTMWPRPTIQPT